ncbi:PLP-dependent aminotransferase family protein [Hyphomicrobium sp.]|jgi:DNA-binding transcriptional MocR family regulator|uniref:aminotransferase-like domain-containing protein n=1 Tax=Hyphomicrobium sp. TaxID=82 RepID=UPI002B7DC8FA|nr:PLP-dependent aminotransferase family protein [Hyphomicrobium sp.]HVZ04428.1 PLP-dependent aminotransferase family protein [Hyphomicrobium sp.]
MPESELKYLGIADALEADIRGGRVRSGVRLPSQRAIAGHLGVDLTTVTRAFNEARKRGLIDAKVGCGTFVRWLGGNAKRIGLAAVPAIDLSLNIPAQPAAARLQHRIPETMANLLSGEHGLLHLHYQESAGSGPDRAAAAVWLNERIETAKPSRVVLTSGAQSALFGICECLIAPGERIAAGAFTYPGLKAIARQRGYGLEPLAMDGEGILPDAFEACCQRSAPKAIYLIPAIDNPTAATLPEDRRHRIVAIARQHNVTIIEDDPYSPLLDVPRVPFARLAPELTWHIATLSKCVSPALRIAYVAAPSEAHAMRLAGVLRAVNLMAPPLNAALASSWIVEGVLEEIRGAIREEAAARQRIARSALRQFAFAAEPHGHHVWLQMPSYWRANDLAEHAERVGIAVIPSAAFAVSEPVYEAVRISLGAAEDRQVLADGLTRLADLLAQPVLPAKAIV